MSDLKPNPQKEKDLFRDLCLNKDRFSILKKARKSWAKAIRLRDLLENLWIIDNKCRHCKEEISKEDFTVYFTYWKACWSPCHKKCINDLTKQEAYECQCIDADCNDCKHFIRGEEVTRKSPCVKNPYYILVSNGRCAKKDVLAISRSNFCSGYDCFEHRKSI